ncbi:MAG: tRNA (N(6)-L-threonylcarbamoyladenosine(37)-C(2))-methylthiotransferase MtaB [Clostridia bacterium]|nr:tRNA (N(6)-L-threonylcarbamoyladenosine(37)-C(2))-methylthiotransferase MtaB [Clostridia bacterium]
MKTIAVYTLGCKVNQYDTEAMLEAFERAGYVSVPWESEADVYLINTCTVTGTGDKKSLKTIRRMARNYPDCGIIVCGCLAQREADSISEMDNVKLVVGVQRRAEAVQLFEQALAEGRTINAVAPLKGASFENLFVVRHEGKTRATMKIQEGCDRYCSYCIIPTVRGPVRSMPLADVRAEAKRLADSGYGEIVITGIHMASYGRGTDDTLIDAIRAVHDTPGVRRVRIGSLEPKVATPEFAEALAAMPGLARQFHLSLQSGSETVLKRMNRRYTPDEYYAAVTALKTAMPDCALTTDVIVGFPGETDAEFEASCDFVRKCGLARLHVFPYSRRSGTVADRMPDQIDESVKHERATALIAIGNQLEEAFVKNTVGTTQSVLWETCNANGETEGYTGNYVRVRGRGIPNTFSDVRIIGTDGTTALAEE